MLEDRRHASSKEQIERLIDAKIDAIPANVSERQRQLSTSLSTNTPSQSKMMRSGLIIASFPIPIRAYTQRLGNNPDHA